MSSSFVSCGSHDIDVLALQEIRNGSCDIPDYSTTTYPFSSKDAGSTVLVKNGLSFSRSVVHSRHSLAPCSWSQFISISVTWGGVNESQSILRGRVSGYIFLETSIEKEGSILRAIVVILPVEKWTPSSKAIMNRSTHTFTLPLSY